MTDQILNLLGLAKKAGKLEIGEEPVGAVARSRHARLILLASDAAANSARRAATFGQAGNVLFLTLPHTKSELGFALGRSSVAMLALTDAGFAGALGKALSQLDNEKYGAAALQLEEKAERILQRQKEQRRHEKNLQRGKGRPWAPPPPPPAKKERKPKAERTFDEEKPPYKKPDGDFKGGRPPYKKPDGDFKGGRPPYKKYGDSKPSYPARNFSSHAPTGRKPSVQRPFADKKRLTVSSKPHGGQPYSEKRGVPHDE